MTGLRERKKERARQTLIDSTRGLLETMHSSDVTVEHIAELSELSARTFFRYFDTKLDAVYAACGVPERLPAEPTEYPYGVAGEADRERAYVVEQALAELDIDVVLLDRLIDERLLTRGELIDRLSGGELERLPAAANVVVALMEGITQHAASE